MEISYDALKRMIRDVIMEMTPVESNPQLQGLTDSDTNTRSYCKNLVRGELSKEFINSLDRIEKASKGNLKKNK